MTSVLARGGPVPILSSQEGGAGGGAARARETRVLSVLSIVQGYLAHKKTHPPVALR